MSKLIEREVTVSCGVNNGRAYLYTGEPGDFPQRNYIVHVNNDVGELAMQGASPSRPLLLTVETGSHRRLSALATTVYDGPFRIFGEGYMGYGDRAGGDNSFWFGLTEGLYHMVVQVTGRAEAYAREDAGTDRLLMMTEEEWHEQMHAPVEDSDIEPIEHWWINFTKRIDDVDDDVILPYRIPMTVERALWAALPGGAGTQEYLDEAAVYLAKLETQPVGRFLAEPLELIRAEQERRRQPPPDPQRAPPGAEPGDFGVVLGEEGKIIGYTGNAAMDARPDDEGSKDPE